jgi:hypothetical protein
MQAAGDAARPTPTALLGSRGAWQPTVVQAECGRAPPSRAVSITKCQQVLPSTRAAAGPVTMHGTAVVPYRLTSARCGDARECLPARGGWPDDSTRLAHWAALPQCAAPTPSAPTAAAPPALSPSRLSTGRAPSARHATKACGATAHPRPSLAAPKARCPWLPAGGAHTALAGSRTELLGMRTPGTAAPRRPCC